MWFCFLNFIKDFFKSNKDGNETQDSILKLKKDKSFISSLIQPWLDILEESNLSIIDKSQKRKEIIEIGHFIHSFDSSLKIENPLDESPDIILSKGKSTIGVELKDLVILDNEKEKEGIFNKLFKQIETKLKSEKQKISGLYEIEVLNENLPLKNKDKKAIKNEIVALIKGQIINQQYIKNITKIDSNSEISLYKSESLTSTLLTQDIIEDKISSKERLLNSYSTQALDEIWLLLVIAGATKSSYNSLENSLQITKTAIKSNFSRIFIYNFFERKTIELKVIPAK